jgi:hypothetical protein
MTLKGQQPHSYYCYSETAKRGFIKVNRLPYFESSVGEEVENKDGPSQLPVGPKHEDQTGPMDREPAHKKIPN